MANAMVTVRHTYRRTHNLTTAYNLKFYGSSFPRSILMTSSQGCRYNVTRKSGVLDVSDEDATRKRVP